MAEEGDIRMDYENSCGQKDREKNDRESNTRRERSGGGEKEEEEEEKPFRVEDYFCDGEIAFETGSDPIERHF